MFVEENVFYMIMTIEDYQLLRGSHYKKYSARIIKSVICRIKERNMNILKIH